MVVVLLVVIPFAVSNRDGVTVDLWPLPVVLPTPLFVIVLGAVFFGFIAGGLVAWLNAGRTRRRARLESRRAAGLEKSLDTLKDKIDELESQHRARPADGG